MSVFLFELRFNAPAGDSVLDALYEAGWDDAVVSLNPRIGGDGIASFDREAPSAVHAVTSAIQEGDAAGVHITGVSEDPVTVTEIAKRTGRSISTVDHWAAGRDGAGDFPRPTLEQPVNSMYSWSEVATWLHVHGMVELPESELELARICEAADAMIRSRNLQEKLPAAERKTLAGVVGSMARRPTFPRD